ncbi:MAG: hypothetical protein IPK97_14110 [Ahniella sp.]|nr:hypothetical protein [Ahniella sp.]
MNGKLEQAFVADPNLYDAYQVEGLMVDSFSYYSYTLGNRFTVKKVARDFELDAQPVAPADAASRGG